jgi:diguanylate cyclase (GGDEF)-like protein
MGLIAVMLHREGEKEAATLRHLAHHDCLTGLPNRTALKQCIATLIADKRREPSKFAVMFIDLDGFKQVNDRHGHMAGDDLLRCVAERLSSLSNANSGFVGRTGGDEFLIVQDAPRQPYAAQELGERLIRSFLKPLVFDDRLVHVGLSIGVAVFPDDGETADMLLSRADWALYQAKEEGRRCVVCQAPPSGAAFEWAPRTEPTALSA